MEAVNKHIEILLEAIRNTDVYKEYKKQDDILKSSPQLCERVDQFRSDNFRLQNEAGDDNLFHIVEKLSRESAELRRVPEVNAYLDAELALCKMMQKICSDLISGIDVHVPEI